MNTLIFTERIKYEYFEFETITAKLLSNIFSYFIPLVAFFVGETINGFYVYCIHFCGLDFFFLVSFCSVSI